MGKVACSKPCKDCPFLRGKDYLHPERAYQIASDVIAGRNFSCHKTTKTDSEGETYSDSTSKLCGGSLIMMEKALPGVGCFANNYIRVMSRLGFFDPDTLDLKADVYESPCEMREGHSDRHNI